MAAWVAAAAAAEGLTLVRSWGTTGFAAVRQPKEAKAERPFMLRLRKEKEGSGTVIGYYASAEEAALAYARILGPEDSAREAQQFESKQNPMTAAQALAAAKAEGLTLKRGRADNLSSPYKHVAHKPENRARPYRLTISTTRGGVKVVLKTGRFATAEEAALEAARYHASALSVPRAPRGYGETDAKSTQATAGDDDDSEEDMPLSKRQQLLRAGLWTPRPSGR